VFVIGDEGDIYTTTDKEGKFKLNVLFSQIRYVRKYVMVSNLSNYFAEIRLKKHKKPLSG